MLDLAIGEYITPSDLRPTTVGLFLEKQVPLFLIAQSGVVKCVVLVLKWTD